MIFLILLIHKMMAGCSENGSDKWLVSIGAIYKNTAAGL